MVKRIIIKDINANEQFVLPLSYTRVIEIHNLKMKDVRSVNNIYTLYAVLIIGFSVTAVFPCLSFAAVEVKSELLKTPEKITELLDRKQIIPKQVPNPHWNAHGCAACHTAKPSKKNIKLRNKSVAIM